MKYGCVSSGSPEATEIGMSVLRQGGNAVDAAIAVSFALGVSEPAMSGIGGGSQVQLWLPGSSSSIAIDGSTLSGSKTPTGFAKSDLRGHLRSTVPSTVKVMGHLFEQYASGNLSWSQLLSPAVSLAEEGYPVGPYRRAVYDRYEDRLILCPTCQDYLLEQDSIDRQPKVAMALRLIAEQGAQAMYTGPIAESIARDMATHDGWIVLDDLAQFGITERESVHFRHNGFEVFTHGEPCGGWVVRSILEELSRRRQADDYRTAEDLRHRVEAIHHGHSQRMRGSIVARESATGETTHFSIVDQEGMAIAVSASINAYYGAAVANPEYGFMYNSYVDDFVFHDSSSLYAVGPRRSAYSSMSPTIVAKDGEVLLVIGSPGSARIISTVAQLIDYYTLHVEDHDALAHMLAAARVHAEQGDLYFESSQDEEAYLRLGSLDSSLSVTTPPTGLGLHGLNAYFGGVHAIVKIGEHYVPLADPRRDGAAARE